MKDIEQLSDKIEDELNDAEEYVRLALEKKELDKPTADTYLVLSAEEMKHANMLHDRVVAKIEEYRKAHGDPPADMMARYEYLHKKHIKHATNIKLMQAMYKE